MLEAIKAFGEDAFKKSGSDEQLEVIEYEMSKIFMQHHQDYYFAVVLKGVTTSTDKDKLSEKLYDFAEKENNTLNQQNITGETKQYLSDKLKEYFD